MTVDVEQLARHLARLMCPDALLTADEVGSVLGGYSGRYVRDVMAKVNAFPRPLRLPLPDGKIGDPRWRRGDITDYINRLASPPKPGRARKEMVSL